jgi:DNA-binding NtrC family response regulator
MRARLTVEGLDGQAVAYELTTDRPSSMGRSRDNAIVLRDEHASRLHAKIAFESGRWLLRDYGLNGTRVNGQRVQGDHELDDGHEIRIGDTRMRFALETAGPARRPSHTPLPAVQSSTATAEMALDPLSALAQFVKATAGDRDPRDLVRLALPLLQVQTGAALVGYLALDPAEPAPQVLPERANLPAALCQHLTRRAQRENRLIRLGTDSGETQAGDGTSPFSDALCAPLVSAGRAFGVLHAYRSEGLFDDRDGRLAEVLTGYLSRRLDGQQARRARDAENARLRQYVAAGDDLAGDGPALQRLRAQIDAAAPGSAPVLFQGEGGSGKELAALALHRRGPRPGGPFVSVQCAGIAPSAFPTELLGYARGAFRGAERDGPGLLDQAADGTLFLDEVADLPPDCQDALVKLLDGHGFRPVGSTADRPGTCRVVAATRLDLAAEVEAGRFRADLFERLRAKLVRVPPLRERREDVPALARYFLDRLTVECRREVRLTDAAVRRLTDHAWPGNVRELRAVLEAAVARATGDTLDADAFLPDGGAAAESSADRPGSLRLDEVEVWAIRQALARAGNDLYRAAALLDLTPDRLGAKLREHQLAPAEAEEPATHWPSRNGVS